MIDTEKIIVPGEVIWEKEVREPNTEVVDGKTYATVLGMLREDRFIPLELVYKPKVGDNVIGIVTDVRHSGYSVDLNLAYDGFINSKFTRVSFRKADIIYGKIKFVDEVGGVDITDAKRLPAGKLMKVPASKVPRIIGKKSSMLNLIRDGSGCTIFVGNNGYIWIGGKGNLPLVLRTFGLIIEKAHTRGLTDTIAEYLRSQGANVKVPTGEEGERTQGFEEGPHQDAKREKSDEKEKELDIEEM